MKFRADEDQTVTRGNWNYIADVGAGSITLSYAPNGTMFIGSIYDISALLQ